MTPEQIRLCQQSWAEVEPISTTAAELFYSNLFTSDPALEGLFNGDMSEQGKKLMSMISAAVRLLDKPEELIPAVQRLGERHVTYGVNPAHYPTVGQALLLTLSQGLNEKFTPEVEQAWTSAYDLLADTMISAARN